MCCFPNLRNSRALLVLILLLAASPIWAQRVAGPPTLQQLQPEDNEPIQDDPWGRRIWMRERFSGEPLDYKDMMLRETQRQNQLYPQLAPGIVPLSPIPTWVSIGPTNATFETNGVTLNVVDSGRARTILPDPVDVNTVYLLTSGGGLWKTTNFLQVNPTWVPKTDALPTTGGGSVAFGRTSNVLYLGLGDPFDDFPLAGGFVTKSTNGGDTWGPVINLANATSVRDIKVDISGGNDIVMVATDAGFFRSADGGATYDASPNPSIGARVLWSLANTSAGWLVSAADGTLWLSTDKGATWSQTGTPGFTGAGRSTLGIGLPGDVVVYAFAGNPGGTDQLDLFRSPDGGLTWTALGLGSKAPSNPNADNSNMDIMHGQAFYNQMILVDPTDATRSTVYIGGNLCTARTTDGGATWTLITDWLPRSGANLPYAHADFHAAAISTLTSPAKLFFGSDGGLFVSNDTGASWDYRKNIGIVSHLIYALTTNPNSLSTTIIGLQDNGTRVREGSTTIYDQTRGGDGFGVGTSQANTTWTLSTYIHGAVDNSTDLGAHWSVATTGINTGDTPFATAITNPLASADPAGTVFFTVGLHDVYETSNGASSWTSIGSFGAPGTAQTIRALVHVVGVSPVDTSHIAVAGTSGNLLLTTNGGASWTQVPLNTAVPGYNSSNTNIAWVNNSILYVCSEAFNSGAIRVVKSINGGSTWTAASNGLPDASVSKLQIDPSDNTGNTVYAGTFVGVYQTTDGGASWHKFGAGLPNVHVTDIFMPPNGSFIRISTYGRGVWEINPLVRTITHFSVTAPGSVNAGSAFSVTVTAQDINNSTVTDYTGTVHFTSSDGQAVLPVDYTFVAGDNGVHVFNNVILGTLGSQTVTATDAAASLTGTSAGITVNPGAATHFNVTGAPANIIAGNAFSITVTAKDSFNNTATGYAGTVRFTSGDPQAVLPGNSTLASGVGTFPSVTLKTAGPRTVIATDTVTGSITGASSVINVSNAAASKYSMTSPPTATVGAPFTVRLVAQDQFNNTAKNYAGTVHFTTTDAAGGVIVPGDYIFLAGDNGQKMFTNAFKLQTAGAQSITAKDTVTSSITATNPITVTADA
ncbi:MAG TPA: hypothetical protein VK738_19380, partial [Terriglobales bacterium]|nr:hypothetical protein [Terriglobales bacterium]